MAKPRILLVEDYAPNVLVATTLLDMFDYASDVVSTGTQAIEQRIGGNYVLILMDVEMQGMNGLDATKRIREYERENNLPRMPIVGMTAHVLAGDKERCLASGMDDYIPKPFTPEALKNKLDSILNIK
jgi:CheY-like chemotaxis protein